MRIRDVYLLSGQTLTDTQTVTVNLAGVGKILYLRIQYQNTNGATSNTLCRLNALVTSIAVIDGSRVIQSLSMREAMTRNAFMFKRLPFQVLTEAAAAVLTEECYMDFRRFPGDINYYMDTSMYQNPQLQLTHAFTISATAGFATGQGKLSVIARVIDSGAPTRLGIVGAKEVNSFASAASGTTITNLPVDFPTSAIMVINPVDGALADAYLNNFKLTLNADQFVAANLSFDDLLRQNLLEYGEFEQKIGALADTSATLTGDVYYRTRGFGGPVDATAKLLVTAAVGNQLTIAMTTGGTAGGPQATLKGQAPHAGVIYQFGDGIDPTQMFAPLPTDIWQLVLTNAATGATPKVVAVQLLA